MKHLSVNGRQAIDDLAGRHGFSSGAVRSMHESVIQGNATMAQFSHPEFGGSGQWMSGGMTMLSDMFNDQLKNRVASLCSDIAQLLNNQPNLLESESIHQQNHGSGQQGSGAGESHPKTDWWPADLHRPDSAGAQNGVRYAYFGKACRLAIERDGKVTLYDTLDHRISGVSQQQSGSASLTFSSQHGSVDVGRLPVVRSS